jgi:RimJ/RimL family protein N-acetyltransferase
MITFRPIEFNDCAFLNEIRNECAAEYLHNSSTYPLEQTQKWFHTLDVPYYTVFNDNDKIGYFRLSNYSKIHRNIYIGMDLHKDFRGKGLAYESYCRFIPFLIKQYNLHKISLEVLVSNQRAYNLYLKLGFVHEGAKRQEVNKHETYIDSVVMSILKSEVLNNKIYEFV